MQHVLHEPQPPVGLQDHQLAPQESTHAHPFMLLYCTHNYLLTQPHLINTPARLPVCQIINMATNAVVRLLGKPENTERFLRIALWQGLPRKVCGVLWWCGVHVSESCPEE